MKTEKLHIRTLIILFWITLCVPLLLKAQNELQIHHVNIGNGDCTIIAITDSSGNVTNKTIIDGGQSNYGTSLIPYINQVFGGNTHFDNLILSHFHRDHYNGLLALGNGTIDADYIIDGGHYTIANGNHDGSLEPPNTTFPPPPAPGVWETNVTNYGNNVNNNAVRPVNLSDFPTDIGDTLVLGVIKGVRVYLISLAANGSNIGANGNIINNITGGRNNQNNYSLGWLLVYGKFRYYTAGDIGGYSANYTQQIPDINGGNINVTGYCGHYTDQETTMAVGLQHLLPNAQPKGGGNNVAGHICAAKISHHGSACSNNQALLGTLNAAVYITSAGSSNSWKLPKLNTIYNLSQTQSVSNNAKPTWGLYNQGFYFTNLYNFTNQASLTYANWCFANRVNTNYNYGNDNGNTSGSYEIIVPPQNINNYSDFYVWRINCPYDFNNNIPPFRFLARFECHQ